MGSPINTGRRGKGLELRGLGCGPLALDSEVRIWELWCGVHEFALLLLSRHPK